MRESYYDLLCATLLGLGNLFMFMGYDSQLTIVEPVLRSVHDGSPYTIAAHAGYYGAAICNLFFFLTSLAAPCVLAMLGSKYTLLLGSALFTLHLLSFQYIHYLLYYGTSATIGIGYALFYSGHGAYITEHSTKATIERNSALSWALATSCLIVGGVIVALTANNPSDVTSDLANTPNATVTEGRSYRQYSEWEIRLVYGVFALFCVLSNAIFALVPTRNVTDSIAAGFKKRQDNFVEQIKRVGETFIDARTLYITPLCCLLGFSTCFWVAAFPATLIFSKTLSGHIFLSALYLVTLGSGEIIMGMIISFASKRIKDFAQLPSLIIGSIMFLAAMVLALLSTPPEATYSPTDAPTPLLEPSPVIALVIALLLGMSDNSFNTARTVICALIIPGKIPELYSISKFYQSLLSTVVLFTAPFTSMPVHFGIISSLCLVSLFCYWRAVIKMRKEDKKEKLENSESTDSVVTQADIVE
ncbi:hypothetical protein PRIPAC_89402 [Pristionchus pacificus]|uniref:Uncharacterized protein n=1 Tax=Pristionchus pacificus TaxID=54126 RepID=A0A454XIB7_PRIPA|nr:hypothetical protein PRIPAC_89402 [Pristionchus pacificus]|eukprot:PDM61458.1 hypothetical protein PRIPAC_50900 [Pristionchus pacificus]